MRRQVYNVNSFFVDKCLVTDGRRTFLLREASLFRRTESTGVRITGNGDRDCRFLVRGVGDRRRFSATAHLSFRLRRWLTYLACRSKDKGADGFNDDMWESAERTKGNVSASLRSYGETCSVSPFSHTKTLHRVGTTRVTSVSYARRPIQ